MTSDLTIHQGDCLQVLRGMPDESVHCCVTSPPYWGLRDYGCEGQIGLEETVQEWVARMVEVFREVRRVLREDGTCWVNLGDSYSDSSDRTGVKRKDLVGQPWRVAFALQADGWFLRQDIIWHKPNPMPESIRDRCTKAHEYLFLITKADRYFWDFEANQEPVTGTAHPRASDTGVGFGHGYDPVQKPRSKRGVPAGWATEGGDHSAVSHQKNGVHRKAKAATNGVKQNGLFSQAVTQLVTRRNRRSVWTIQSEPYEEAHFATFPTELPRRCILAGCPVGGTVLDPFGGSGTTGQVALELGRKAILIELNPEYVALARRRCSITPGLPLA